jgi:hypothetical protein
MIHICNGRRLRTDEYSWKMIIIYSKGMRLYNFQVWVVTCHYFLTIVGNDTYYTIQFTYLLNKHTQKKNIYLIKVTVNKLCLIPIEVILFYLRDLPRIKQQSQTLRFYSFVLQVWYSSKTKFLNKKGRTYVLIFHISYQPTEKGLPHFGKKKLYAFFI